MFGVDCDGLVGGWTQALDVHSVFPDAAEVSFYDELDVGFYWFGWQERQQES